MNKEFGGCTIVSYLEYPEGAILESDRGILHLRVYERIKSGEVVINYRVVEDTEIGNILEVFYDERGKLRKPKEIIDIAIYKALHVKNMKSDFKQILVDEAVSLIYEAREAYLES